ncbi:Os03g0414900 [Oryza sativa Japonica Group]|uniref:Os03g0414900 protein n=1 Tax=Oryza sativa subsp. japonica TaxID=39947 RepID=A0A0P0VYR8_ORYSJ|nr:hypothetical protein EE612_018111 [Oryza sativa]BAS84691.1 Os03g0414900 [Oryza sativa Japonica Group]
MHRRRQHGSSGELDVFGATRYFAGVATAARPIAVVVVREPEDMIIQVKTTTTTSSDKKTTEKEGHHHAGQLDVVGVAKTTHRSKLAAFLGSLVSPESTSFRKKPPPAASSETTTYNYNDDDNLPKMQGVRVVRCGRCDEERWVVRCGACCAWEEEEEEHHHGHEKKAILAAAATSTRYGSHQVLAGDREVVGDGACSDWESDSSSDLFELDLEIT